MSAMKFTATMAILLFTTACGDTWGQRAVTGGAIGAGSGAVIGSATGIGILPGGRRRRRRGDHAGALISGWRDRSSASPAADVLGRDDLSSTEST